MNWTWDPNKNESNKLKHRISFEFAERVFEDPLYFTDNDPYPYEERYQAIGVVEGNLILVVHTLTSGEAETDSETGRIISARKPTPHERAAYEKSRD